MREDHRGAISGLSNHKSNLGSFLFGFENRPFKHDLFSDVSNDGDDSEGDDNDDFCLFWGDDGDECYLSALWLEKEPSRGRVVSVANN